MTKTRTAKLIPEADAAPVDNRVLWSIHQFHFETGRTRETIRKRIARADIKPGGFGPAGHPMYRCFDVLPILYAADENGGTDPEKLDPFSRKSHYQAEAERRKLLVDAGDLITRDAFVEEMARVLRLVQQFADTIPDVLERDCGLTPDQVARVEAQCDQLRNNLADDLSKFEAQAALIAEARGPAEIPEIEIENDSAPPAEAPTVEVAEEPAAAAPVERPVSAFDQLFG